MRLWFVLGVINIALSGCATYSLMRPASTLRQGKVEAAGGLAFGFIAVNPVLSARVGAMDRLEVTGQYEVHSALGGLRVGVVQAKPSGFALAVGAEGGVIGVPLDRLSVKQSSSDDSTFSIDAGPYKSFGALGPNITIGFSAENKFDIYLGGKALYAPAVPEDAKLWGVFQTNGTYLVVTGKLGARAYIRDQIMIGAETGITVTPLWVSPEATGYIGFVF